MHWNTYYLWAGMLLLSLILHHYFRQRKANDRNSRIFYNLIFLGIGVCTVSILLTELQPAASPVDRWSIYGLVTMLYLFQSLLPYMVFQFSITRMPVESQKKRKLHGLSLLPLMLHMLFLVLNIPFHYISYVSEDGLLHANTLYYTLFNISLLVYYIFNLFYVFWHHRELGLQNTTALTEACLIVIIGSVLQQFLSIQLCFGFAIALSVTVLHITLKNVYAYIDIKTRVFCSEYFSTWMNEKFDSSNSGIIILIDLYGLSRIERLYTESFAEDLLSHIADRLWNLDKDCKVFRLSHGRFVIHTNHQKHADSILGQLSHIFALDFSIKGEKVLCPAILCQLNPRKFKSEKELIAYMDFLIQQSTLYGDTLIIPDSEKMKAQFSYECTVEKFLEEAIEKNLFQVWYQPIYSLTQKKYVTLEALSRLKHPTLGWISPEVFIRIASAHGDMITKITPLQLKKICGFIKENEHALKSIDNIKINLTPRELLDPVYCDKLLSIIQEYHIPFSKFQFEITESMATQYSAELHLCIRKLQNAGIGICLDDFGSGYANLNAVLKLPFSVIKIDRSMLDGICDNERVAHFYQNMIYILKKQGYLIVSEGVESLRELELLSKWNVDMVQGYCFSKPLSGEEIIPLLLQTNKRCLWLCG